MTKIIEQGLATLAESGNLRQIPEDATGSGRIDFSSNDYLGIASRSDLQKEFLNYTHPKNF